MYDGKKVRQHQQLAIYSFGKWQKTRCIATMFSDTNALVMLISENSPASFAIHDLLVNSRGTNAQRRKITIAYSWLVNYPQPGAVPVVVATLWMPKIKTEIVNCRRIWFSGRPKKTTLFLVEAENVLHTNCKLLLLFREGSTMFNGSYANFIALSIIWNMIAILEEWCSAKALHAEHIRVNMDWDMIFFPAFIRASRVCCICELGACICAACIHPLLHFSFYIVLFACTTISLTQWLDWCFSRDAFFGSTRMQCK